METLGNPPVVRERAHSDLKSQATALSFHTAITIIAAATIFYIMKSYWLYAIMSAGIGYGLYRWPRFSAWAVILVATPFMLSFLWKHFFLSMATVVLAVLAYSMADESKREQLHAAAAELYEPFKATMSTATSNLNVAASNVGAKTANVTRRTVTTVKESAQ